MGVKVTSTVQLLPTGRLSPLRQVPPATAKSLPAVVTMLPSTSGALAVEALVSVTGCAGLAVSRSSAPNARLLGASTGCGIATICR